MIVLPGVGMAQSLPGQRLPDQKEDRGIRSGAFRIWPSFFFETRYDSNLFRANADDSIGPLAATIFRFIPGLQLRNPDATLVELFFAAQGDFRIYSASGSHAGTVESQKNLGGRAQARAQFFPRNFFQVFVEDSFERALQSRNQVDKATFTRLYNLAGGGIRLAPAPDALTFDLGYKFIRDTFEDFGSADISTHQFYLRSRWKFFPRTEAFLNADAAIRKYDSPVELGGVQIGNFSSTPVWVKGGLNGYITRRLFVTLDAGWGSSMHEEGASYNGVLADALVGYSLSKTLLVQGGYTRGFEESLFGNFFASDTVHANAQARLFRLVTLEASCRYGFIKYGRIEAAIPGYTYSENPRKDQLLGANATVGVDFVRYLGVNLGVDYTRVMTDFSSTYAGASGSVTDHGAFDKLEVFGNVVVRY